MKFVVLVKQVPDTWGERKLDLSTGRVDRAAGDSVIDEINERALEVALQYKDSHKDAEVIALSMGPASVAESLRKALSMGADSAVHILDDDYVGSDAVKTSAVLAAALATLSADVIVAGNLSTDGRGGVIPAMIAERLGLPCLSSFDTVEFDEASVRGERTTEAGTLSGHSTLPAVVSITERAPEGRFPSFKGIMSAKKKPFTVLDAAQLAASTDPVAASSVVVSTVERPPRTAGRVVVDDGAAAGELAEFLIAGRLV